MRGEDRIRRLRWLCRRGMKELDVLLESFLERQRAPLERGEWPQFETFLETEDNQLWEWIRNGHPTEPTAYPDLIDAIRKRA